jgi:MFS family permease
VQLVAQVLLLASALGIAVVTLAGFVTEWWLFGLLLLHGLAGAIGNPSQQTLVHDLVGGGRLLSAVGLNSSMRHVAHVLGPLVAGYFLLELSAGWGFLVNALTFVPLLVVLALVRPRHRPAVERLELGTRASLEESGRFLRSRPDLAAVIGVEMVGVVFLGHALSSLMPAFATDVFRVGELGYIGLVAATGAGALVGGVWLSWSFVRRRGALILAAAVAEAGAILLFAVTTSYLLAALLLVAAGFAGVVTQALANSVLQLAAPDRLRGRVMGAYTFGTMGVRVVNGPLLGGAAQVLLSLPLAVGAAALAVVALLAGIAAAAPGLRRLD